MEKTDMEKTGNGKNSARKKGPLDDELSQSFQCHEHGTRTDVTQTDGRTDGVMVTKTYESIRAAAATQYNSRLGSADRHRIILI